MLLEAWVGIEIEERTGTIDFIGLNIQRNS